MLQVSAKDTRFFLAFGRWFVNLSTAIKRRRGRKKWFNRLDSDASTFWLGLVGTCWGFLSSSWPSPIKCTITQDWLLRLSWEEEEEEEEEEDLTSQCPMLLLLRYFREKKKGRKKENLLRSSGEIFGQNIRMWVSRHGGLFVHWSSAQSYGIQMSTCNKNGQPVRIFKNAFISSFLLYFLFIYFYFFAHISFRFYSAVAVAAAAAAAGRRL